MKSPNRMDECLRGAHAPPLGLRPGHRAELERALAARHAARYPLSRGGAIAMVARRVAVVCAAAAVLGFGARRAPAVALVDLGRRIVLVLPPGEAVPDPEEILLEIGRPPEGYGEDAEGAADAGDAEGHAGRRDLRAVIRVDRDDDGSTRLRIDAWGLAEPQSPVADRLRRAFAELERADIIEEPLRGEARTSFFDKLCHEMLGRDLPEADLEDARAALLERLRAVEGPEADIDLDVEREGDRQRVRVRVRKEGCRGVDAGCDEEEM